MSDVIVYCTGYDPFIINKMPTYCLHILRECLTAGLLRTGNLFQALARIDEELASRQWWFKILKLIRVV